MSKDADDIISDLLEEANQALESVEVGKLKRDSSWHSIQSSPTVKYFKEVSY